MYIYSPTHSLIMDPYSPDWNKYFTQAQINEIKSENRPLLPELSNELREYIFSYRPKVGNLLWNDVFDVNHGVVIYVY